MKQQNKPYLDNMNEKDKLLIILVTALGIIAFFLIIEGSDSYANRKNIIGWKRIVVNISSLLFAVSVSGSFINFYYNLILKKYKD